MNSASLSIFTRKKWCVQSGMAASGTAPCFIATVSGSRFLGISTDQRVEAFLKSPDTVWFNWTFPLSGKKVATSPIREPRGYPRRHSSDVSKAEKKPEIAVSLCVYFPNE